MTEKPLVKIAFRDADGEVETLWAFDLGDKRYQLDNTPWFQYGVSLKDIVEAETEEEGGFAVFQRVIEKSGYRTVRIALDEAASDDFLAEIRALGCSYEGATPKYIAVEVPPAVDLHTVTQFLTDRGIRWEHADPTYEGLHAS
jgi:hypothetical protein